MDVKAAYATFLQTRDLCCFIYSEDMLVVLMAAKTRSMLCKPQQKIQTQCTGNQTDYSKQNIVNVRKMST